MENFRQGDLTDIVRASGGGQTSSSASAPPPPVIPVDSWQFPSDPMAFLIDHHHHHHNRDHKINNTIIDTFGDPFSNMRDPLLHELNLVASTGAYYTPPNSTAVVSSTITTPTTGVDGGRTESGSSTNFPGQSIFDDHHNLKSTPCNIFSRIQISQSSNPNSPVMAAASAPRPVMVPGEMVNVSSSPKGCLLENAANVQISSPRNLGIKRRKSQAKKVVCIPAPAAANSRSTGEVVPSDLWAWRKYGQKPIKGSPYPRGYYRCSSSKGCSARKQVERSRTDPNMLVITYTSEHNHPWPTQRNALAGSTRSQTSKGSTSNSSLMSSSSGGSQQPTKEETKDNSSNDTMSPNNMINSGCSSSNAAASTGFVKEEVEVEHLEMDDDNNHGGFCQSYRPELPGYQGEDNFFAELDEIEPDSLNLLYTTVHNKDHGTSKGGAASMSGGGGDPFSLFDWPNEDKNTH